MTEIKTRGQFRIETEGPDTDGKVDLTVIDKYGSGMSLYLSDAQRVELIKALNWNSVPAASGWGRCEIGATGCTGVATFYGPNPYVLELDGKIEDVRVCTSCHQNLCDDI
jgi:hypothetical protein